jgi:hypothetical protein
MLFPGRSTYRTESRTHTRCGGADMLWTIAVVLIILWALGMVSSYTIGGLIHVLLIVAIIMILVRVIQGRKVL